MGNRRISWIRFSVSFKGPVLRSVILLSLAAGALLLAITGTQQATAQVCPQCECKICHGPVGPHAGGFPGCDACHGFPPINSAGLVFFPEPTGSTTAGGHSKHATSSGYNYSCETCHFNGMPATTISEDPPLLQMGFSAGASGGSYDGHALQSPYLYEATNNTTVTANGTMTCSNLYCHSNGTSVATGAFPASISPAWGTAGPLACSTCHGYPPSYAQDQPKSNSHSRHTFTTCNTCHYATTTDGVTIANVSNHANAAYNVSPDPNALYNGNPVSFSYSFDPGGGHCSNISCHGTNNANHIWGGVILNAGIGWAPGPACFEVQFTGHLDGTPPETFLWNFGDSQTGEGEIISHTYPQAGTYTVQLSATDANRHNATASLSVNATGANAPPVPSRTISVAGFTVTVTDFSTDPDYNSCGHTGQGAVRAQWGASGVPETVISADLTDAPPAVGRSISHTYSAAGNYVIGHAVKDNASANYVASGNVQVTVPATLSISGRVVRLDGTTPVPSASMRLLQGASVVKTTSTATDGTYSFVNVVPGSYTVRAIKTGLVFVDQPVTITTSSVTGVNLTADR
jgi:predicted CxxxxCH...CXXCH cytochrome family protein